MGSRNADQVKSAWESVVVANERRFQRMMLDLKANEEIPTAELPLRVYAELLRRVGAPYLRGDFSSWLAVHEYNWNWLVAHEIVNNIGWGEEITAENVERRFLNVREYLQGLRKEFGQRSAHVKLTS